MKTPHVPLNKLLFVAVCGLFVAHALYYLPFFSDDGFISLRYSKRWIEGLGLTWTDGERVEGYTNLLWVLLNGVTGWVLSDFVLSTRLWGIIGGMLCIGFCAIDPVRPVRIRKTRLLTGGMFLALSAPLAVWSIAGLEQSFFAGAIAGALFWLMFALDSETPRTRELMLSGLFFGITAITRADGVVILAAGVAGVLLSRGISRQSVRIIAILSILPAAMFGSQLIFRMVYYGELLPNTALVKVAFNALRLRLGVMYVTGALFVLSVLFLAATAGALFTMKRSKRHRWVLPITTLLVWTGYVILVGGDIFHGWRQMVPVLVPLAFIVSDGAASVDAVFPKHKVVSVAMLTLVLGSHFSFQLLDERCRDAKQMEQWVWSGQSIGRLLKRAFGKQQPLLAVDAAGSLPYWTEFPSLDMLGLTDKHIATNPPPSFGEGGIGHELGDGNYVLSRRPDIIVFNNASGSTEPFWLSAKQMFAQPRFHRDYRMVRVRSYSNKPATLFMFARRENGRIGIQRTKGKIRIPGYLFSNMTPLPARMGENDTLYTPVDSRGLAYLGNIPVDKGTWLMSTDRPMPPDGFRVTCPGGVIHQIKSFDSPKTPYALKIAAPRLVNIGIRPPAATATPLALYEVTLSRVPDSEATMTCTSATEPHPPRPL